MPAGRTLDDANTEGQSCAQQRHTRLVGLKKQADDEGEDKARTPHPASHTRARTLSPRPTLLASLASSRVIVRQKTAEVDGRKDEQKARDPSPGWPAFVDYEELLQVKVR
ncbi:hypothetical protein CERZMDRAFT_88106 [Cercospora zeae-maydis SCOH1-5]|uniref:Uncharacterized protein n=1 Tax=Cercospora zeae-maydis SCOH1-5 TaxID=717836 RepID=A0A6A6F408_9PEZI|nr:hypothetical protein CERZMDRAFT_88106 [Cercospora zeae-maydis SCOH1-5]